MDEVEELLGTLANLRDELETLAVRGVRSVGRDQVRTLAMLRDEFSRVGAGYLAARITAVLDAIDREDRQAAAILLSTQASVRVFERSLTLKSVGIQLDELIDESEESEVSDDVDADTDAEQGDL